MNLMSTICSLFKKDRHTKHIFSIKETVDLTGLPIITLRSKGNKVNMLVDTGSTSTIIDRRYKDMFDITDEKLSEYHVQSMGGLIDVSECSLRMHYDGYLFDIKADIADCSDTFSSIAVNLHGILGSDFLEKYKYIINYEDLKIYKHVYRS